MSSWKTVTLGEVAAVERSAIQPEDIRAGTTYVGLEHIETGGAFLAPMPVGPGELASSKFQFTDRHVLYGKLRPYLAKIACPDFSGICSTDILPILPGPKVERRFLFQFLRQPAIVDYANSRAVGVNLPRLSPSVLASFDMPLPPLAEQRLIAEVLDRAEALRAKRRAALAQLDTLTQALFADFHRRAQTVSRVAPLVDVAQRTRGSFVNGPFGSDLLTTELQDHGVPVIYIRDIRDGEYRRISRVCVSARKARDLAICGVNPGDVLVAKVGGPPGVAAAYPDDQPPAIVTQDVIRIRLDTNIALPEYIAGYLNSSVGRQKIKGISIEATRARFSLGQFKRLDIELPPVRLQADFGARNAAVEKLRIRHRASLAEMDALFASLQHRAFRGEL